MKLHHFPGTRSARVFWTAQELGVPLDINSVDLTKGEHKQPDFIKLSPHGRVPAFEVQEQGLTMIESGAICMYLIDTAPNGETLLPPKGSAARAKCYQWVFYAASSLDDITIPPFLHKTVFPEGRRDNGLIESCGKTWREVVVPYLSQNLGEQEFFCGAKFSLADIMVGYDLFFAHQLGWLSDSPKLQAYVGRISSRDGFKKSFGM